MIILHRNILERASAQDMAVLPRLHGPTSTRGTTSAHVQAQNAPSKQSSTKAPIFLKSPTRRILHGQLVSLTLTEQISFIMPFYESPTLRHTSDWSIIALIPHSLRGKRSIISALRLWQIFPNKQAYEGVDPRTRKPGSLPIPRVMVDMQLLINERLINQWRGTGLTLFPIREVTPLCFW